MRTSYLFFAMSLFHYVTGIWFTEGEIQEACFATGTLCIILTGVAAMLRFVAEDKGFF